jgi:hypothetical protein
MRLADSYFGLGFAVALLPEAEQSGLVIAYDDVGVGADEAAPGI